VTGPPRIRDRADSRPVMRPAQDLGWIASSSPLGVMTDLGVLADGGENGSRANDINNHGWVVGASDATGGEFHAVLWR
jgi:hypothetical protein